MAAATPGREVRPRELVVLGTASQAPTRERATNGYLLRWGRLGLLVDPGEGTQRQLLLAGERTAGVTHVLLTHEHGDHTLGLPGVVLRMALEQRRRPVVLVHPRAAAGQVDRLLGIGLRDVPVEVRRIALPDDEPSVVSLGGGVVLEAVPLRHRVPTLGYAVREAGGRRMDPDRLAAAGVAGPDVGRLQRDGRIRVGGRAVVLEDVSDPLPDRAAAVAMDTAWCDGLLHVLRGCDLALVESTYLDGEEDLAERWLHLTAGQAGRAAAAAGVRRLVLTHYSQRHPDERVFAEQAGRHHPDVVGARDLDVIEVPPRRPVADPRP
jgi:ribonuclease Z